LLCRPTGAAARDRERQSRLARAHSKTLTGRAEHGGLRTGQKTSRGRVCQRVGWFYEGNRKNCSGCSGVRSLTTAVKRGFSPSPFLRGPGRGDSGSTTSRKAPLPEGVGLGRGHPGQTGCSLRQQELLASGALDQAAFCSRRSSPQRLSSFSSFPLVIPRARHMLSLSQL